VTVSLDDLLIPLNSPKKMFFWELVKQKKNASNWPSPVHKVDDAEISPAVSEVCGGRLMGQLSTANMTGKKHKLLNMGNVWKYHVISLDRRTENYQEGTSKAYFNLTNEV